MKRVTPMMRIVEGFRPSDYFYDEIGLTKARIMLILQAYPGIPDKLKAMLNKAYESLSEAKDFFDGCEMMVVPSKK